MCVAHVFQLVGVNTRYTGLGCCARAVGALHSSHELCTPARRSDPTSPLFDLHWSIGPHPQDRRQALHQRTLAHQRSCGTPCGIRECVPAPVTDSEGGGWDWMCIQEGALKPVLSSYGCYSGRYRVRGLVFRGRGAEGPRHWRCLSLSRRPRCGAVWNQYTGTAIAW